MLKEDISVSPGAVILGRLSSILSREGLGIAPPTLV